MRLRLQPVPENFLCPISTSIMEDPVATVDGAVYERAYIEQWFRSCRQGRREITSPATNLPLPSVELVSLVALQSAIETYLTHRPELKTELTAKRSLEQASLVLQEELLEKQAIYG